jgi:hypothetical protein
MDELTQSDVLALTSPFATDDGYAIGWFNEAEGVEGELHLEADPEECAQNGSFDYAHIVICHAVKGMADYLGRTGELLWESRASASAALWVAKAKLKELRSKKPPLEEWEQKALAAGWRPPKGRM